MHSFLYKAFMSILDRSGLDGDMLTCSVDLEPVLQGWVITTEKSKQDPASMTVQRYTMGEGVVYMADNVG